jgi:hypothetical protein
MLLLQLLLFETQAAAPCPRAVLELKVIQHARRS